MFVRKTLMGVLAGALAATAVWSAAPAHAETLPDDTTFTPVANDLIGVGSDTSQHAVKLLADAYNAANPGAGYRVATFQALGGGQIPLPSGDINRPNGSGAGKSLLYGAGDNADIDYARSSSGLNDAEKAAGLQAIPFALDSLQMAVSANVASNAPVKLTPAQIVSIYKGDITNWNEVGGSAGTIVPMIPQSGSGTRSFFIGELKKMNAGVDVVLAAGVQEVQEHEDDPIKGNANAIAPFSVGRAGLTPGTLRLLSTTANGGWNADRALYNVVRQADAASAKVQAVFGSAGFFCSDAATDLINEAGFGQLARPGDGGVCGQVGQSSATNFTLNLPAEPIETTTSVAGTSPGAKKATLKATVASSPTAQGTVDFFEGETKVGSAPLVGGVATLNLTGVAPGKHSYTATFVPAEDTDFVESSDATPAVVTVKTSATIAESFPSAVKKGARAKGTVTVTLAGISAKATGKVVVKKGAKTVGSGTLSNGKVTITLVKLAKGKNSLTISWAGDKNGVKATKSFTITQK
ncbi:ABC-type phosphate transport system substrate-binding protein [Nocardioides thalensis]|uniref:ABC-type phosphate transport system substrate-binding protein n=1 Tax=Nocardioides thalensis TaxID=1914755 RepID=A0A853C117_9ACTN|nr:Ig-like domain repeat protein [Nocardioides thalensis]NYJ00308.1 ABC-type phosphate transport system substrate-binding protein [Nocardioides thalensis]